MEVAIPVNKISSLSSGEFVGMVADNPDQKIELKAFCAEVLNDHKALATEQALYKELPVVSKVESAEVLKSFLQVKKEVGEIVQAEMERMLDTPELAPLNHQKANSLIRVDVSNLVRDLRTSIPVVFTPLIVAFTLQ